MTDQTIIISRIVASVVIHAVDFPSFLKYTVSIIAVSIKTVKQKIFLPKLMRSGRKTLRLAFADQHTQVSGGGVVARVVRMI
ncbi:MAG: hypothetical protein SOR74_06540, partial [Candidatus Faecivicinus sp.]|nr:hypothetical protein [Candidatus Faecivicinus sp.]